MVLSERCVDLSLHLGQRVVELVQSVLRDTCELLAAPIGEEPEVGVPVRFALVEDPLDGVREALVAPLVRLEVSTSSRMPMFLVGMTSFVFAFGFVSSLN